MEWTRWIGYCLLCAVLIMILKQMNSTFAPLVSIAFGTLALGALLPKVGEWIIFVQQFVERTSLQTAYWQVMLKTVGIVLITQIAYETCCELGANTVANRVVFCGRIALFGVVIPVLTSLLELVTGGKI